ncbi:MAG: penicillin-binding protein 2, partial [Microbacteriaceae bacterium]|nr:penicillin-binding protein 2 [Microbacteriaceae bacterium]
MTRRLRRITILVFLMFLALFTSTSIIQVLSASSLQADSRNTRTTISSYSVQRGEILAGDQVIAKSVPVNSLYRFQRQYIDSELYSSVVGYYTRTQGSAGIEQAMNSELTGKSDTQFFDRIRTLVTGRGQQGASVTLTIDPKIQQAAKTALGSQVGSAVALNPKTGQILAMVSNPGYDANQLTGSDTDTV